MPVAAGSSRTRARPAGRRRFRLVPHPGLGAHPGPRSGCAAASSVLPWRAPARCRVPAPSTPAARRLRAVRRCRRARCGWPSGHQHALHAADDAELRMCSRVSNHSSTPCTLKRSSLPSAATISRIWFDACSDASIYGKRSTGGAFSTIATDRVKEPFGWFRSYCGFSARRPSSSGNCTSPFAATPARCARRCGSGSVQNHLLRRHVPALAQDARARHQPVVTTTSSAGRNDSTAPYTAPPTCRHATAATAPQPTRPGSGNDGTCRHCAQCGVAVNCRRQARKCGL